MNKDIKIMVELQRYWSRILSLKEETSRCRKNILFWKAGLEEKNKESQSAAKSLADVRSEVKRIELDLDTADARLRKLQERKTTLASEKEIAAVDREIEKARGEDEALAERLIQLIDDQADCEKKAEETAADAAEASEQFVKDNEYINSKIAALEADIAAETEKFDTLFPNLTVSHQSRFKKLLGSKDGIGIAKLEGEVCGACHFQIPSQLAVEASGTNAIISCTNCGRYIYAE